MTCDELDSLLHPYLDGEFDQDERFDFDRHLSGCPACTRKTHEAQAFRQLLRQRARSAAQASAPDALRSALRSGVRSAQRREATIRWAKVSAAAVVLVALGGGAWELRPREEEKIVSDAALRHAKGLPFEIQQANPEAVEAWFGGKLDHRVALPRFQNATLAGARLSNVTDKPAAYVSYDTEATGTARKRLGLFVFDDAHGDVDAAPLPAVEVKNRHGYNVALWRQGEIVYELVTDLDEADIRRMLEAQGDGAVRAPPEHNISEPEPEPGPMVSQMPYSTPALPIQQASYPR